MHQGDDAEGRRRTSADWSVLAAVAAVLPEGVSGAVVIDRCVYRGAGGMAGEIGHLTVEYPDAARAEQRSARRKWLGFDDPCPCGQPGHVDAFATPVRISDELRGMGFERAAEAPGHDADGQLNRIGTAFKIAGRALAGGLADVINAVNPGHLLVLLPPALVDPKPGTGAEQYRTAMEMAVDAAFSTGSADARAGRDLLTVEALADRDLHVLGARAGAVRVMDQFLGDLRRTA
jgi:predicted NBD/HSP70 family sugar kinase